MEVILLEAVVKLGKVGDIVNVKNGYARNFLIPQGKGLRATNENKVEFEARKSDIEKVNKEKRELAEKEGKNIDGKFITIICQAGEDGRLYGSVASRDVALAVSELGVEVRRNQVSMPKPIKFLGIYEEKVILHPEVSFKIFINIARSQDEAEEAQKSYLSGGTDKKKEKKPENEGNQVDEENQEAVESGKPKKKKKVKAENKGKDEKEVVEETA